MLNPTNLLAASSSSSTDSDFNRVLKEEDSAEDDKKKTLTDFERVIQNFNTKMYISPKRTPDNQAVYIGCEMLARYGTTGGSITTSGTQQRNVF